MKAIWITAALTIAGALSLSSCGRIARERAYDHRLEASAKEQDGDYKGAIAGYTRAIKLNPDYVDAYEGRARVRSITGDLEGAIADHDRVIALAPRNEKAYFGRAHAKYRQGDAGGAIADYTQAITIAPTFALTYVNRGNARHSQGDLDGAQEDYDHALFLDPKLVSAHVSRGTLKEARHDPEGAMADFNRALELNPRSVSAHVARGICRAAVSSADAAIADFDRAIQLDPKNLTAYCNRAFARAMKADVEGAIADCTHALELDPNYAYALKCRGQVSYLARRWKDAQRDWMRYVEAAPKDEGYPRLLLCLAQWRQGETDAAHQALAAYVDRRLNGRPADWISMIAGHLLGKVSEAELLAAAKAPNAGKEEEQLCEAWYYAGMTKLLAGDKAAAAERFEKCIGTGKTIFTEHHFARSELKLLRP